MIEKLLIKNFKSIKHMEINCSKINLFIGEPNTGKSNILEALGLLSWWRYPKKDLKEYIRFQSIPNLFYDNLIDEMVEIKTIEGNTEIDIKIKFKENKFFIEGNVLFMDINQEERRLKGVLDYQGNLLPYSLFQGIQTPVKFYRFINLTNSSDTNTSFLMPPHGSNMFSVIMKHKNLREIVTKFLKDYGFRLVLKPVERVFEFQKQVEDIVFGYPYVLLSATLQRMIFYEIAIESNKDSTLIFEEPEVHTFPYYTKYLGEIIGLDKTNQYFITTYSPYLLLSILEKAQKDSVNVFITYFRDYQTKVKCLSGDVVSEIMDYDIFFNLDFFIENR